MTLTPFGKTMRALSMYGKGRAFLRAAALPKSVAASDPSNDEATEYVVLHLLCQGVENALKAVLLLNDFDYWNCRLRGTIRHRLLRAAQAAAATYGQNPPRAETRDQLSRLDALYQQQRLRYANVHDELVAPSTINTERLWRRAAALLRLTERELRKANLVG